MPYGNNFDKKRVESIIPNYKQLVLRGNNEKLKFSAQNFPSP